MAQKPWERMSTEERVQFLFDVVVQQNNEIDRLRSRVGMCESEVGNLHSKIDTLKKNG